MAIDLSTSNPFILFIAIVLAVIVAVIMVRFFWHHILKYLVQGCLVIVVIMVVLAVLRYYKVF